VAKFVLCALRGDEQLPVVVNICAQKSAMIWCTRTQAAG